ncbi:hypothetical protein [Campylobacter gracilis]|nr:hypothetical protein [Campylobacter gracilis]
MDPGLPYGLRKIYCEHDCVCMIARALMWLNLKEKNEYSFYGNA